MKRLKQLPKTTIALLCIIAILTSTTIAAVLYSLVIPNHFGVNISYGLELWDSTKTTKLTSIEWGFVDRGSVTVKSFYLKNTANKAQNVSMVIGAYNTSAWQITTTYTNQTIDKGAWSSAFSITLAEVNAVADGQTSCDINFNVVDSFLSGSEEIKISFGATTTIYEAATNTYLSLINSGTNKQNYSLNENGSFWYTTRNIKPSEELIAFQSRVEMLKDGSIFQIVEGNTTHTVHLMPNEIANLSVPFISPSELGSYAFRVIYCLADSVIVPPPEHYSYITLQYNSISNFEMRRILTVITNPYRYDFSDLTVGQTFTSESMYAKSLGSPRFLYIKNLGYTNIPSGYTARVEFYSGGVWSLWVTNDKKEIDSTTNGVQFRTVITNNSGLSSADFSNFRLTFEVTTS